MQVNLLDLSSVLSTFIGYVNKKENHINGFQKEIRVCV